MANAILARGAHIPLAVLAPESGLHDETLVAFYRHGAPLGNRFRAALLQAILRLENRAGRRRPRRGPSARQGHPAASKGARW